MRIASLEGAQEIIGVPCLAAMSVKGKVDYDNRISCSSFGIQGGSSTLADKQWIDLVVRK